MAWLEISISVARESTAMVEFCLQQSGALAITLEDDEDNPVLEPGPGATPLWPTVQVRGLFGQDVDRERVIEILVSGNDGFRPDQIRWRSLADQDWERAWIDRFKPMKFGQRLWIVPSGMEIPEDPKNIEIQLDPGLAFGTGTHPTTALCLAWLDGQDVESKTVIDYGCGSGILGIAAALKGAKHVICVDNDPQALEATESNSARNGVSGVVETRAPQAAIRPQANLVIANILALPLIELAPLLLDSLLEGGALALSGILAEQLDDVQAAYRAELASVSSQSREGWVLLQGRRKGRSAGAADQKS